MVEGVGSEPTLPTAKNGGTIAPSKPDVVITPPVSVAVTSQLNVGVTRDIRKAPVTLEPSELSCHAAFLGGSGSGKTTVALNLIEQLALQEVPAILIDRKGDLCGYATDSWKANANDSTDMAERRRLLRERLDVTIYTPGHPEGNALTIRLTPPDMHLLPTFDQETQASLTGAAIAGMMGLKSTTSDQKLLTILITAIRLLALSQPDVEISVNALADFIGSQDPTLVGEFPWADMRLFKKLAESLGMLNRRHSILISSADAKLDVGALLGKGIHSKPGKTRLSIISTKFLGDNAVVEFWLAQFLTAVETWLSKNPASHLQGILMLDEADIYLPAISKPATKQPIENLLRRGRSAGFGMFLATQSPGDMDYKCRDNIQSWFLGRIQQDTALRKIKALLDDRGVVGGQISGQSTGQFVLSRPKKVETIQAASSALKTQQLNEGEILTLARHTKQARLK